MRLVSFIKSAPELDLEERREDLRDRRWARRRDKVKLGACFLLAYSSTATLDEVLRRLP